MGRVNLKYLLRIKARGKFYYYFRYQGDRWPLPDKDDPTFLIKYQEMRNAIEQERSEKPTGKYPGTIGWLIERYRQTNKYTSLRPSSKRNTDHFFRVIDEAWGDKQVHALGVMELEDLTRPYADRPGAMTKLLAAASKLFNYSIRLEMRTSNPCFGFDRPGLGEYEPWPEWLLRAALESDDWQFRRGVAVHYYTGQRTSDACCMAWHAMKGGEIDFNQMKKGDAPHMVPVHQALTAELETGERNAVTMLETYTGRPLTPNTFRRWCREFCEAHGVEGYTPHGLRKNAVCVLLEVGCTAAQVAAITDQSLQMVEKYAKRRNKVVIARQAMALWNDAGTESVKRVIPMCKT